MDVCEEIRAGCREIALGARWVEIDGDVLGVTALPPPPPLDPEIHYLEGSEEDVAAYVLALDAINFGSGWFDDMATASGEPFGYEATAHGLAEAFRADGAWTASALAEMTAPRIADALGIDPGHDLATLYAGALAELGRWLGDRGALAAIARAGGSACALAGMLAAELPTWSDPGFLKRAQIAASDLALAGVAEFADLDRLTAFADNVLPHVLRLDGVLMVDAELCARIDAGVELSHGSAEERELRACAVLAVDLLAARNGMAPRDADNVLWTRGQQPHYRSPPPHRTRTTCY